MEFAFTDVMTGTLRDFVAALSALTPNEGVAAVLALALELGAVASLRSLSSSRPAAAESVEFDEAA